MARWEGRVGVQSRKHVYPFQVKSVDMCSQKGPTKKTEVLHNSLAHELLIF